MSKADEEPYFVVSGVILTPDGQWNEVEGWMRSLVLKYLGEEAFPAYGRHFNFHAKDIWHGSGLFPRDRWSLKKRMELFEAISLVPKVFSLPVVYGYFKRDDFHKAAGRFIGGDKNRLDATMHAHAFTRAARSIDQWMIENTTNEVIMLVAEDMQPSKKTVIDTYHAIYVDRAAERRPGAFQAERIIEQVSFMRKDQSGILQLADMCAFILKRKLQKCPKVQPFFDNIKDCIFHRTRDETSLFVKIPASSLSLVDESGERRRLSEMPPQSDQRQFRRRSS